MSLNVALGLFLDEYQKARASQFADNSVAEFVRKDIPQAIGNIIGGDGRYSIQGSAGQGVWAALPWVAVFDELITDSAQDGYYLVYLPREDFKGVYLSLNQGVLSVKAQYGAKTKRALKARAIDFAAKLDDRIKGRLKGPIDLRATGQLGKSYEAGAICSVYYDREGLPADDLLADDLQWFLELYRTLVDREGQLFEHVAVEEDERSLGIENLTDLRMHKRVERNKKLSAAAKKIHGYVCHACGFNYEEHYGVIGKSYIEAHHLTPLGSIKGTKITLSPREDFAVLCANCHRMIHRSKYVGDIEGFRSAHLPFSLKAPKKKRRRSSVAI